MISYNDDLLELSDLAANEKEASAQASQTTERIDLIENCVERLKNESDRMKLEYDQNQKEYEQMLLQLKDDFYYKSMHERHQFLEKINERYIIFKVKTEICLFN